MNYLDDFESELTQAGIPAGRRGRILAEFADHLYEDPQAELGSPHDLAREFADQMGTRLARVTAYRAFGVLAIAAAVLGVTFFEGGRTWGGWVGYGSHPASAYMPSWWVALLFVCFISGQVALAAGSLAVLRAWRLRHQAVISAADARILNHRAAVGLIAGAITMLLLPATDLMLARPLHLGVPVTNHWQSLFAVISPRWWDYVAIIGGPILIAAMLSMLPSVLAAARMRPQQPGIAGDLTTDLGAQGTRTTPVGVALVLSALIVVSITLIGVGSDDPVDGLARGLADAVACMIGFTVLGTYLGLRTTS